MNAENFLLRARLFRVRRGVGGVIRENKRVPPRLKRFGGRLKNAPRGGLDIDDDQDGFFLHQLGDALARGGVGSPEIRLRNIMNAL